MVCDCGGFERFDKFRRITIRVYEKRDREKERREGRERKERKERRERRGEKRREEREERFFLIRRGGVMSLI